MMFTEPVNKSVSLDAEALNELAVMLKAMAHPTRLWILQFLVKQDCCISSEIADELPFARSTISEHLRQLKEAGLIQGEIEHPRIKYCINKTNWNKVKDLLETLFHQHLLSTPLKKCNSK